MIHLLEASVCFGFLAYGVYAAFRDLMEYLA